MALHQLLLLPRAVRLLSAVPLQAASRSWGPCGLLKGNVAGADVSLQGSKLCSSVASTASAAASPPAAAAAGTGAAAASPTTSAAAATGAAAAGAPSQLAASAYTLIARASATLNQLTGYHTIEAVKQSMVAADERLQQLKRDLRQQKVAYDEALAQQTHIHREMTSLLQRKAAWGPSDVTRFAELAGQEHANERAVGEARSTYNVLLEEVEAAQLGLTGLIRERYQQEQIWSDKIRRASTWWTWGLLGAHFTSFVVVYSIIEPRKRAALQAAIAGMLQEQQAALLGAWGEREEAAAAGTAAGGAGKGVAAAGVGTPFTGAVAAGGRQALVAGGGGGPAAGSGAGSVRDLGGPAAQQQEPQHHQQQQEVMQNSTAVAEQQRQAGAVGQAGGTGAVPATGAGRAERVQQQPGKQLGDIRPQPGLQVQQQQQQQQGQHKEPAAVAAALAAQQTTKEPQQQQEHMQSADAPTRAKDWLQQKSRQLQAAAAGSWQAVSSRLRGATEQQALEAGGTLSAAAAGALTAGPGAQDTTKQQQTAGASSIEGSGASRGQPQWVASCKAALQQQYTLTFGQLAVVSTSSLALGVLGSWLLTAVTGPAKAGGSGSAAAGP